MEHTEDKNDILSGAEANEVALLLRQIRSPEGDGESGFDALVERYLPLIEAVVDRFSDALVSDTDVDDLRQEALMSLYRAAVSFDLSQDKVSFGLYARICMTNSLISYVRAYKKSSEEQVLPISEDICAEETPLSALEDEERLRNTYEVIRRVLSPLEYGVWQYYVGGASAKEIAEKLGRSEKSAANAISRIRKKLRAAREEFNF